MLQHMYDLPPTQEFISVKFSECGQPLTYPSCCVCSLKTSPYFSSWPTQVWSPLGLAELRTRARNEGGAIAQFMLDSLRTLTPEGGSAFTNPQAVEPATSHWRKCLVPEE